jgi:hypothetical protein
MGLCFAVMCCALLCGVGRDGLACVESGEPLTLHPRLTTLPLNQLKSKTTNQTVAFLRAAEALQLYTEVRGDAAFAAARWAQVGAELLKQPFYWDRVAAALALTPEEQEDFLRRLGGRDLAAEAEERTLAHLLLRADSADLTRVDWRRLKVCVCFFIRVLSCRLHVHARSPPDNRSQPCASHNALIKHQTTNQKPKTGGEDPAAAPAGRVALAPRPHPRAGGRRRARAARDRQQRRRRRRP